MPRLRCGQDLSSATRGILCSLRCRLPGNPLRCAPFCTGHSESHENWGDRRAQGSTRRARSQKTRKSFRAPADRRAPKRTSVTYLFFCDESYDSPKSKRVAGAPPLEPKSYVEGGLFGDPKPWARVERLWREKNKRVGVSR